MHVVRTRVQSERTASFPRTRTYYMSDAADADAPGDHTGKLNAEAAAAAAAVTGQQASCQQPYHCCTTYGRRALYY